MDFNVSLLRAQITGNESKLKYVSSRLSGVSITTYCLFILIGLATWFAINGVLLEAPILAAFTPECNKLKSYVVIIIQLANIGPILYLGIKGCLKIAGKETGLFDTIATYCVLCLGVVSCLMITILWQKQIHIFGRAISMWFFILTACIALANNTSTVLILPYLTAFPGFYLSALYVGEGLSGFLPSIWLTIQGMPKAINCSQPGHDGVRFEPGIYFLVLVLCSFLSLIGFSLLHILPAPRKEKNKIEIRQMSNLNLTKTQNRHFTYRPSKKNRRSGWYVFNNSNTADWHTSSIESCESNHYNFESLNDTTPVLGSQENKWIWLSIFLFIIFIISALSNSLLFQFLPYYTIHYGEATFHWALNFYFISTTASSIFGGIFYSKHRSLYPILTSLYIAMSVWFIYLATTSPTLPMQNTIFGGFHVVVLSILAGITVGYVKVGVTINVRSMGGELFLLLVGIVFQLGTLTGSLIAFITIDWTGSIKL